MTLMLVMAQVAPKWIIKNEKTQNKITDLESRNPLPCTNQGQLEQVAGWCPAGLSISVGDQPKCKVSSAFEREIFL